jgi:hypothetical protein
MTTITLQVPDVLAQLPTKERDSQRRAGLWQAITARREQLKSEITEASEQIKAFSTRYGVSFTRFEAELLPNLESWQAHEDYNETTGFFGKVCSQKNKTF